VSFQVAAHQTERYQVATSVYTGPLDLLLELIENAQLDITTLALAQVTDQYLSHMKDIRDRDAAEVSAFLVIAARLVQIKSAALLPRPPAVDSTSDDLADGEALALQLILYRRFKQISAWLTERESMNLRTHLRVAPMAVKIEPRLDLTGLTLQDVVLAARETLAGAPDLPELSLVVNFPRVTIREKIHSIIETIKHTTRSTFQSLLIRRNRVEVVVTFLALLELIKRHVIEAEQSSLFGEIEFSPIGSLDESELDDIEFSE
jgi:segregation and condensation protein A